MGRWSYLDTDEERLPEGMTRVGYDADTQVYTYRDSDGSYWEGAPGCRYGKLHRVRSATPPLPSVHIPDNVEGDEAPYVLYDSSDLDDDGDNDDHTLPSSPHDNDDEKTHTLASPDKAKLHNGANPPPHHPALAKTLPDLPTTDDTSSLSGTTARESVITAPSDITNKEKHQSHDHTSSSSGLKRTGTLSRIARLFSSSPSSSSQRNVSRRSTFNGGTAAESRDRHGGGRDGKGARLTRRSTHAADAGTRETAGQWPGAHDGAAPGGSRVRKRATTFDEILGKD